MHVRDRDARAFRNFLSRGPPRGGTCLFSYDLSLSSSVSFSRCDDNDSAEREQSSSIRLLMRVIIEPGSPVLIMRFRICRRARTDTHAAASILRRHYVHVAHVYVHRAYTRVSARAHSHARAFDANIRAWLCQLSWFCWSHTNNNNSDDGRRNRPRIRNDTFFFFSFDESI